MEFECENLTTLGCPRMDAVEEFKKEEIGQVSYKQLSFF